MIKATIKNGGKNQKTYSRRDSPVVTDLSTNLPIRGLIQDERTGIHALLCLWPYVLFYDRKEIYIVMPKLVAEFGGTFLRGRGNGEGRTWYLGTTGGNLASPPHHLEKHSPRHIIHRLSEIRRFLGVGGAGFTQLLQHSAQRSRRWKVMVGGFGRLSDQKSEDTEHHLSRIRMDCRHNQKNPHDADLNKLYNPPRVKIFMMISPRSPWPFSDRPRSIHPHLLSTTAPRSSRLRAKQVYPSTLPSNPWYGLLEPVL